MPTPDGARAPHVPPSGVISCRKRTRACNASIVRATPKARAADRACLSRLRLMKRTTGAVVSGPMLAAPRGRAPARSVIRVRRAQRIAARPANLVQAHFEAAHAAVLVLRVAAPELRAPGPLTGHRRRRRANPDRRARAEGHHKPHRKPP